MATLDIKKGYRNYSPEQLREYAYSGVLSCGNVDLSDFIEYIFQGVEFNIDQRLEFQYDRGFEDGVAQGKWDAESFDIDDCK